MIRRLFLILFGVTFLGFFAMLNFRRPFTRELIYRIRMFFESPKETVKEEERKITILPEERYSVSIEKALNSRCTSDNDNEQKIFHWGMFDQTRKLSEPQFSELINRAKIPRFTEFPIEIKREKNLLTLITPNDLPEEKRQWLMVESGMLQQAICLICAASGVAMVFRSLGENGSPLNSSKLAVISMRIDAMKPSYHGGYWSKEPPLGEQSWRSGNLKDPKRDGPKPLLRAFDNLRANDPSGKRASQDEVGQLLWAARGRTPHFYKSRPWGMTIPTSQGRQDRSRIYTLLNQTLYRYENWSKNHPSHSLLAIGKMKEEELKPAQTMVTGYKRLIVLSINETTGRAFWEVGFQLMNLILQAFSLEIGYQAILFDQTEQNAVERLGVRNPVAGFAI